MQDTCPSAIKFAIKLRFETEKCETDKCETDKCETEREFYLIFVWHPDSGQCIMPCQIASNVDTLNSKPLLKV